MEMVKKTAVDPSTGEEYEVMPTPEEVRNGILELEFPPEGIRVKDAVAQLADKFQLSDEQRNAKYRSGSNVFYITVRRELTRFLKDGTLVQPNGKGTPYCLSQTPPRPPSHDPAPTPEPSVSVVEDNLSPTAEESIETNYQQIQGELAADLLQRIKDNSPAFFEELVIDLLVAMGYGGSREEAGRAVGGSSDGGIDGIINEDILGLDVVYVQAKRWEGNVSRPEIQKFAGALQGQRARKGIFITTSDFTREARDYVTTIETKIVLIDGYQLAQFMIDHNVGVSVVKSYEIKRVDSDYFAEEGE